MSPSTSPSTRIESLAPTCRPDFALKMARSMFCKDIALAATDPNIEYPALPAELNSLPNAIPSRRMEFTAGRTAVRRAMQKLGLPPMATLHGKDRAPIWPEGLTGSISHTRDVCIAAVAKSDTMRTIGLDLEEATPLDPSLIPVVCTPDEQRWLNSLNGFDRSVAAKMIFAAKESAYKAQFPLSRKLFGFETLNVKISSDLSSFRACFAQEIPPFETGATLRGKISLRDGLIIAAIEIAS